MVYIPVCCRLFEALYQEKGQKEVQHSICNSWHHTGSLSTIRKAPWVIMGFIYYKNSHFGKQLQAKSVLYMVSCSAGMITSSVTMSTSHDSSQFIIFIATRNCWPVVAIILSLNRCGIARVTCHTIAIIMPFCLHIIEMIWKYMYIRSWWSLPLSVAKKLDTKSLLL